MSGQVPLVEAALRNDLEAVELLVEGRADIKVAARGDDFPLVIAIKQGRIQYTLLVRRLLELRADPTVRSYLQTHHWVERSTWTGWSVQQFWSLKTAADF